MRLFETERLEIRGLKSGDKEHFAELFSNPKVLELIPRKAFSEHQITTKFNKKLWN